MGLMDKVKDVLPGSHTGQNQQSEYSKPGNDDFNNPLLNQNQPQGQGMMGGSGVYNQDERGTSSFESSRGSDLGMGSPNTNFSSGENNAGNVGRFLGGEGGMTGYGGIRDDESGGLNSDMGGRTGQSGYGQTSYGDNTDQSGNRMGMGIGETGMVAGNTGMEMRDSGMGGMNNDSDFNTMSGRGNMTGDQFDTTGNRSSGGMQGMGQSQGYGQSQSDY